MRKLSMGRDVDYLFSRERLHSVLYGLAQRTGSFVDAVPKDQFLAATDDVLLEHLLPRLLVTPLDLHEDRIEMEEHEALIDVHDFGHVLKAKGVVVNVAVPFSGDHDYWYLAPNTTFSVPPRGYIEPAPDGYSGVLHIVKEHAHNAPIERLKPEIENELRLIRTLLAYQRAQMDKHNESVPGQVKAAIQARRKRLEIHKSIPAILGIPLKRKVGVPNFEPLQIQRKLIRPLPTVSQAAATPEPGIEEETYQHILAVIRHEGRTFEATPKTYAVHDEEELRDILLAHLNGHYEGSATGEAFRKAGKTDIRIEDKNRAAFVAECKIWRGGKEFTESIDQLLGYLTWRDCKDALVIFNKHNAKFSDVLTNISELLKSHPKFIRELAPANNGEWKTQFSSKEDESRLVTLTVFVFNIFSQQK